MLDPREPDVLASKIAADHHEFRLLNGAEGRMIQAPSSLASWTCAENRDGVWLRAVQALAWEEASVREQHQVLSLCAFPPLTTDKYPVGKQVRIVQYACISASMFASHYVLLRYLQQCVVSYLRRLQEICKLKSFV